jgi:hypothetical protein
MARLFRYAIRSGREDLGGWSGGLVARPKKPVFSPQNTGTSGQLGFRSDPLFGVRAARQKILQQVKPWAPFAGALSEIPVLCWC